MLPKFSHDGNFGGLQMYSRGQTDLCVTEIDVMLRQRQNVFFCLGGIRGIVSVKARVERRAVKMLCPYHRIAAGQPDRKI